MANSCKYYTEKTLGWMLNNKVIVCLSLLCFCLFVSTWALAAQKNRALSKIDDLNAQLATTTTQAPVVNPEEPGTGDNSDNGETGGNGGTDGTGEGGDNVDAGGDGGAGGNNGTGGDEGEVVEPDENGDTGDTGTSPKSRKTYEAINENEGANRKAMEDALENGVVNSNDYFDNVENEIDLRSIIQNSKLLATLAT